MSIIDQIAKLFSKNSNTFVNTPTIPISKYSESEYRQDYEEKSQALERILGPMENLVGHAIIPYALGGPVDMYYYSSALPGTAFVTKELLEPDGTGPIPNRLGTYELIAFTKLPYKPSNDPNEPFNKIENRIKKLFTMTGRCSKEVVLNPMETCEYPWTDSADNVCVFFDEYQKEGTEFSINGRKHHLLLLVEVFRSEMEYAMKKGTRELIKLLKEHNYYPYCDLDRKPVV